MGNNGTSHVERHRCPLYTAIRVIQGRWKPMIFRRLGEGSLGFGELRRTMPGVTVKVLRQQLRELESEDLVARSVRPKPALQVKYPITPHGQTLGPVFENVVDVGYASSRPSGKCGKFISSGECSGKSHLSSRETFTDLSAWRKND